MEAVTIVNFAGEGLNMTLFKIKRVHAPLT
jgi:hypothetical protein